MLFRSAATTKGVLQCAREWPPKEGVSRLEVVARVTMYSPLSSDYFLIERDPLGSGVDFDASWQAEVRDGRIKVTGEKRCEPSTERLREWCSRGDGRLDIWVGSKLLELGGHKYFVMIGNVRKELDVDLTILRAILDSVREVKAHQP